jgi:hypothetical protein
VRSSLIYFSANIIRGDQIEVDDMGGTCSTDGRDEKYFTIAICKTERKRPPRRLRPGWDDNIKMDPK